LPAFAAESGSLAERQLNGLRLQLKSETAATHAMPVRCRHARKPTCGPWAGAYFLARTISSPTIDGLWWLHTIGKVPGLSALNSSLTTWPRFKTRVLS
jgi:hypothetical protein